MPYYHLYYCLATHLHENIKSDEVGRDLEDAVEEEVELVGSSQVAGVEGEAVVDEGVGKPVEEDDDGPGGEVALAEEVAQVALLLVQAVVVQVQGLKEKVMGRKDGLETVSLSQSPS